MNKHVLIVAGGSGQRMQSAIPKQFLELNGLPVLMHTLLKFAVFEPHIHITLVLPETQISYWQQLIDKYHFSVSHNVVAGGTVRFYSVKNGLNEIPDHGLVAVHDGVRPLVSVETIKRCFIDAQKFGNAIPCIPVYETVRRINNLGSEMEIREELRLIQTPQVFNCKLLKEAYNLPYNPSYTDDASVLEHIGETIHLVEGNRENIKITDPLDLILAECLINKV